MAHRNSGINMFIDDIPMKLSDKYRPLDFSIIIEEEIDFPEVLRDNYDFGVEVYALEVSEMSEKIKMEKLLNSMTDVNLSTKETLRSDSSGSDSEPQSNTSDIPNDMTNLKSRISRATSSVHHLNSGEILKPQTTPRGTNISDKLIVNNSINVYNKNINPADFENDTYSPFDNVELQTLDDMRELNSVFQAVRGENMTAVNNKNLTQNNVNHDSSSEPCASQSQSSEMFNRINGVNFQSAYNFQLNAPLNQTPNNWVPYQNNSQLWNASVSTSTTQLPNFQPNQLRSSKSASDLPALFNPELPVNKIRERSHTPPCYSSDMSSKRHVNSRHTLGLNDPYEELSQSSKEIVNSICTMGFERSRVSRAVKYLNNDDKKIFDFLLQVQALEEDGYDSCEAEIALHMNNYQSRKARQFLDSLKQLTEVGFTKEAIVKALIKCDNDRDKALDYLLTTESL